jgi:hypothetical protein
MDQVQRVVQIQLEVIKKFNVAQSFHKSVIIFNTIPAHIDAFIPAWHDFKTRQAMYLQRNNEVL